MSQKPEQLVSLHRLSSTNVRLKIPLPPLKNIEVRSSYDQFFRRQLRRALLNELDGFTAKLPTYHAYIVSAVQKYASDIVDVDVLSFENFRNFLKKGMESDDIRVSVMDAYIQITYPELRKTFFVDTYVETIGLMMADYFNKSDLDAHDRAVLVNKLCGSYLLEGVEESKGVALKDSGPTRCRILVIKQDKSNAYLRCFEVSGKLYRGGQIEISEEVCLVSGYCIPQTHSLISNMRSYADRCPRVGKIIFAPMGDFSDVQEITNITFTYIEDGNPRHKVRQCVYEIINGLEDFLQTQNVRYNAVRINDRKSKVAINNYIDSIGGVL